MPGEAGGLVNTLFLPGCMAAVPELMLMMPAAIAHAVANRCVLPAWLHSAHTLACRRQDGLTCYEAELTRTDQYLCVLWILVYQVRLTSSVSMHRWREGV